MSSSVSLRQSSASNMKHLTLRHAINLASEVTEPPTEVYFLVMGKEATVKSTYFQ